MFLGKNPLHAWGYSIPPRPTSYVPPPNLMLNPSLFLFCFNTVYTGDPEIVDIGIGLHKWLTGSMKEGYFF